MMRVWCATAVGGVLVVLMACGSAERSQDDEETTPESTGGEDAMEAHTEPEAAARPIDDESTDVALGECQVSCCSEELLERQRAAAIEMNDPSLEHECCFCDQSAGGAP